MSERLAFVAQRGLLVLFVGSLLTILLASFL